MNRTFAHFLSIVLHPVLMPTHALFFCCITVPILLTQLNQMKKLALYFCHRAEPLFVFHWPFPIFCFAVDGSILLRWKKKEERHIPFISNALLMMIAYYMMQKLMLPKIFNLLILGAAAAVVLAVIINLKWKISIHMIGIGGIVGTFFGLSAFMLVDLRMPILFQYAACRIVGFRTSTLGASTDANLRRIFVGFFCEYLILSI